MRYLIIGGGISGTSAAEEIRKLDAGSTITILSEEQHPDLLAGSFASLH